MAEKFEYETILINGPNLGVYAGVPFESAKIFGTRKAIRIKATFDGKMYRMSLLPHGNCTHWLHLRKEIRDAIGKEEGDTVSIVIEKDENPPKIEIPEYLEWLFENEPEMLKAFKKMSYSAKKFWIGFIEEPKSGDAKVKRVNRLFEFLKENQKPTLNGKT